jgi:hypothetical protein
MGKYKFTILPFQTGVLGNPFFPFIDGSNEYPKGLWANILYISK